MAANTDKRKCIYIFNPECLIRAAFDRAFVEDSRMRVELEAAGERKKISM